MGGREGIIFSCNPCPALHGHKRRGLQLSCLYTILKHDPASAWGLKLLGEGSPKSPRSRGKSYFRKNFELNDLSRVRRGWAGAGRKAGEFPFIEHLGEPAMTWKLLVKYRRVKKSDKNTTSQGAFEP